MLSRLVNALAKNKLSAFEREWNYDLGYAREILDDAGLDALRPLDALTRLGAYRAGVPAAVYYGAKITAAVAADCGPCAQLTVTMAERAGVDVRVIRALVAGDRDALPDDVRLGADLARATLAREAGDDVRAEILARWGRRGLASLAYGIVVAQAFPQFKYALGHGQSCVRLSVHGETLAVTPLAAV